MDPVEWFEAEGRLIRDDDLAVIAGSAVDKDAEAALLAAEFDDFDEQLVAYDGGLGDAAGGVAEEDGF